MVYGNGVHILGYVLVTAWVSSFLSKFAPSKRIRLVTEAEHWIELSNYIWNFKKTSQKKDKNRYLKNKFFIHDKKILYVYRLQIRYSINILRSKIEW